MTEQQTESTDLVEADQAADILGVSKRTLDRYQDAGLISPIRPMTGKGAKRRFSAVEVRALATRQDVRR